MRQIVAVGAEDRAHGVGDHFLGVRRPVDELRDLAVQAAVEALGEGVGAGARRREAALDDVVGVEADDVDPIDERRDRAGARPSTIAPITSRASCGVSEACAIRIRRYSVIPEMVWTIAVNAASGIT